MCFCEHDPSNKTELERGRNERLQQRQVQFVNRYLVAMASSSKVKLVISRNVTSVALALRKCTNYATALCGDLKSTIGSLDKD